MKHQAGLFSIVLLRVVYRNLVVDSHLTQRERTPSPCSLSVPRADSEPFNSSTSCTSLYDSSPTVDTPTRQRSRTRRPPRCV